MSFCVHLWHASVTQFRCGCRVSKHAPPAKRHFLTNLLDHEVVSDQDAACPHVSLSTPCMSTL